MSSELQPRANETVWFQGDVANIQSLTSIKEGSGIVSDQRCVFEWPGQSFAAEKAELSSVVEVKHGFATKLVVKTHGGESVTIQAPNMRGLKNALLTLAGLESDEAALKPPELSAVKNTTAWLAALGPLWSDLVFLILAAILGWNLNGAPSIFFMLKVVLLKVTVIYIFLKVDHVQLQRQGYNTEALGITGPEKFPYYLFGRAKAFGHSKAYAYTWCALSVFELLALLK